MGGKGLFLEYTPDRYTSLIHPESWLWERKASSLCVPPTLHWKRPTVACTHLVKERESSMSPQSSSDTYTAQLAYTVIGLSFQSLFYGELGKLPLGRLSHVLIPPNIPIGIYTICIPISSYIIWYVHTYIFWAASYLCVLT